MLSIIPIIHIKTEKMNYFKPSKAGLFEGSFSWTGVDLIPLLFQEEPT